MLNVAEAEQIVLGLPLKERGMFAAELLSTLRPADEDDDAIIVEALRRSDELKRNPKMAISLDEMDRRMKERFGWK